MVSLIRGLMRWTVRIWADDIFSVRGGTTVLGIRGCDVMVNYLPESDSLEVFVHEGDVTIRDGRTGLQVGVPEGQWIVVAEGAVEDAGQMDDASWERFTAHSGMEIDESLLEPVLAPAADQPPSSAVAPEAAFTSTLRSWLLIGGAIAAVFVLLIGLGILGVFLLRSR